jgi:tRNA G10  N-methylase Trm11
MKNNLTNLVDFVFFGFKKIVSSIILYILSKYFHYNSYMKDYLFILGREPDLSFAELISIFGSIWTRFGNFAFLSCPEERLMAEVSCLGWTIKIGEIIWRNIEKNSLHAFCTNVIVDSVAEGKKLRVGIDSFVPSLSKMVFHIKDTLKKQGASIRIVQHENGRIKIATTLHEKLITQWIELIITPDIKGGFCVARTIWIQDIKAYSDRDIDRDRSMIVGMMPPKLAQMMLNFATRGERMYTIWDPFCWLGTTLIEALNSRYSSLLWSDLSPEMVVTSKKNIEKCIRDTHSSCEIFQQDAQKIDTKKLTWKTVIVTEWMLGKNFSLETIHYGAVLQERKKLIELYRNFFQSSYCNNDVITLVCCMPFWNIGKESLYMPFFEDFWTQWKIDPICRLWKRYFSHMRPGQHVWREILVLHRADTKHFT